MEAQVSVFWWSSPRVFSTIFLCVCIPSLCLCLPNITCLPGLEAQHPLDIDLISKIDQTVENDTRLTSLDQNLNVSELCKIAADIVGSNLGGFSREKRSIYQDFNNSTSKSTPSSSSVLTDFKTPTSPFPPAKLTTRPPVYSKQGRNATNSSRSNLTTALPNHNKVKLLPIMVPDLSLSAVIPNLVIDQSDLKIRRRPSAALVYAYTLQMLVAAAYEKRIKRCANISGEYDEVNGACKWNSSAKETIHYLSVNHLVHPTVSYYITVVGNAISLLFLVLLIGTFAVHRALRTRPGKSIMCLSVAMATAHAVQLAGLYTIQYTTVCTCIAVFLHWIFLVTFTWMAIMSFDLFITFAFPFRSGKYASETQFKTYNIIALTAPTAALIVCLVLEFTQDRCIGYGQRVCFIGKVWGNLWSFILPVALVMFFNVVCLIATIAKIHRSQTKAREMKSGDVSATRDRIRLCLMALKVSTLTALGWIFGCIGGLASSSLLTYLFLVLTSCQGVLVFVAFCCNQRVYKTVFQRAVEGMGSSTSREKRTLLTLSSDRPQRGNDSYVGKMEDTRA